MYEDIWIRLRQPLDVVNLCLKNGDNDVTATITADVVPMICSPLNYHTFQFSKRNQGHLKDIALSECNPEENLVVYILVEADQYWNIANGEVKRGESGPVSMKHKIWMDTIWSCRECTSLRHSLSQFSSNTCTPS